MDKIDVALLSAIASFIVAVLGWLKARDTEKMKQELHRDLATHQSTLQLQSELRLKLFMVATESTESAIAACRSMQLRLVKVISALQSPDKNRKQREVSASIGCFERLNQAGTFVPPSLDKAFQGARETLVNEWLRATAPTERTEDREELDRMVRAVRSSLDAFLTAVRSWKTREWSRAEDGFFPALPMERRGDTAWGSEGAQANRHIMVQVTCVALHFTV